MTQKTHEIVPAHLAVTAMRDNGYKNAAYAIAELMDNAIQAGATQVELLCGEVKNKTGQRATNQIHQIGVLDNGSGMSADVLRLALQFGNGTYLESNKHTGIGRFGMGLPSSSISQCQRVDVWSWTDSVENALYTYLDIDEIKEKQITEVPTPTSKQIPQVWRQVGKSFRNSGTLVVWSKIDRCMWRTGKAIINNSELLIGRIYRRFLHKGDVQIRLVTFDLEDLYYSSKIDQNALPNDPMYLMEKTSCPEPFSNRSMFIPWEDSEDDIVKFPYLLNGKEHIVSVRFSYASEEARQGQNPGGKLHGKHASKNLGVSIVRAGRELELDAGMVNTHDPTERWWGVEVEFPPALDEIFGVTNNKQSARNFKEFLEIDLDSLVEDGKTIHEYIQELEQSNDPNALLIKIVHKIDNNLSLIRKLLKNQTKGTRKDNSNKRHDPYKVEESATLVTRERQRKGYAGESDKTEILPIPQKKAEIKETLINDGFTETQATEIADITVENNFKYTWTKAYLDDNDAFFSVKSKGGSVMVTLNMNHPAYNNLVEILEKNVEDADIETLKNRLINALDGLELLIMAWARYEDELPPGELKQNASRARRDWGLVAGEFLRSE
ncbi:ATP-binding protein [Synechocystis sp. FACHB-383]|uniref:ATP-binding protein n=1 Tax=Synechocystis sp. FACHB-383 TaxID=2692864 RepID=UPI00168255B0|nr:ATP-binding protein [Synechocystis sp. FACHB-383]MBD2653169.1 ATP-binding protein [Synechocystis sp. FACHB-383]